jgi:alkane 1-monooxygenase
LILNDAARALALCYARNMHQARPFAPWLTHQAYWLAVLLPLLIPLGWQLRELPGMGVAFAWLMPLVLYAALPLADMLVGRDTHNPAPKNHAPLTETMVPLLACACYLGVMLWALFTLNANPEFFGPLALLGWTVSLANAGGIIAINISHELIHRRAAWQRNVGGFMLASVSYGCFKLEHPRWHHVKVATDEDPSSAPAGSNVYLRAPRAYVLNMLCGWQLGKAAALQAGRPAWRNEMLLWYGLSLAMAAGALALWGPLAAAVFIAQGLGAALLLEVINYVEHYGLRRQRRADGRFEPPRKEHSWDADFWLSNALLLQLPRHADHHVNPGRPFIALQRSKEAPQLPFGYATAVVIALVPPLWHRVMDQRLSAGNTQAA